MKSYVFDIEGNGFTPSKFHVVSWQEDGVIKSTHDPIIMKQFFEEKAYYIGHYITHFDIPSAKRVLGCKFKGEIIDTLYLSWYLFPYRVKHSLEDWGTEFNLPKVYISDWESLTPKEYKDRCERDVLITSKLWDHQQKRLLELYGTKEKSLRFIKYLMFKGHCAQLAQQNKWKVDTGLVKFNLKTLQDEEILKVQDLKKVMPKVPEFRTMNKPLKERKADNSLTTVGERWYTNCKELGFDPETTTEIQILKGYSEPNPGSHDQVKKWLFSLGWKPCTFKTNPKKVEVPQINNQEPDKKGELAPSVLKLLEEHPEIEPLTGLFTIQHRASILQGFLDNVDDIGYISAEIAGLTNTLRFKHSVLVNLPSVDKPYGKYIRPCLVARQGCELLGSDMSSLEDRTKQHYMYFYDSGYVNEMNTPDFDPHLDIGLTAGMLTKEDVLDYKEGRRVKEIKPIRHSAKTTNYACTYGAFPAKISKSAGIPLETAQMLWEAYWKRNWAIKKIAEDAPVKTISDGSMWLLNPVSGFWYSLRFEKDKFSTLNQGTGSYCFDLWVSRVLEHTDRLLGQFHDEIILEIPKGDREKYVAILKKTIQETNDILKLNRELDIGIEFGANYGDIH